MTYTIKTIRTKKELNLFENQWKSFEKSVKHTHITSSFYFLNTWWEVFRNINNNEVGFDKRLLIVLLYKNNHLSAIMPLVTLYRKKYLCKVTFIEYLAQQWGATSIDIISHELTNADINFIFKWIYQNIKFDILQLKYIPHTSYLYKKKNRNCISFCGIPEINLKMYRDYEEYQSQEYTKNLKQNIRTAHNKIKKNNIQYNEVIKNFNKDVFKEVKKISLSKLVDNKKSLYLDKNKRVFIYKLLHKINSQILFLIVNNQKVAYRLNVFYSNKKYCLDAAYDRNFKNLQLGSLSVDSNIKDSFNKKLYFHSEGTGLEFYKTKFIKDILYLYMLTQKGNTSFSYFYYLWTLKKEIFTKLKSYRYKDA